MNPGSATPLPERRLSDIRALGQAIWVHGLGARGFGSGRPGRLLARYGISGLAPDLDAFAGAVLRDGDVAEFLCRRFAEGAPVGLDDLLAREAGLAAAGLRATFEASGGSDGFAGVEVGAAAPHDAAALAAKARALFGGAAAPNVLIALPPTDSGFAVFEALLIDAIPAFVGPLYSVASVLKAAAAFARAQAATSAPTSGFVGFGLASLDSATDDLLRARIRASGQDTSALEALLGSAAPALAKVAWRRMHEALLRQRLDAARRSRLRLVWMDLAPADPRQPRQHYVERLIGPDTVTLPDPVLLRALRHCGPVAATLGREIDAAEALLQEIAAAGVDIEAVGKGLENLAVRHSATRYARLDRQVGELAELAAARPRRMRAQGRAGAPLPGDAPEISDALVAIGSLDETDAVSRLWDKDASLWSADADVAALVRHRLGWLDAAVSGGAAIGAQRAFADALAAEGIDGAVLLGMGGSSVTAEVCRGVFDRHRLEVLDSTAPARVSRVASGIDLARTVVMVASKSGTTVEATTLLDCFFSLAAPVLAAPGERFVAITDPGTPLEQVAHERSFRRLWLAPADVGGRFSALTVFGTVPLAVMGVDARALLSSAKAMAAACAPEVPTAANPAARLASALHAAWGNGRDKLTLLAPPPLAAFGTWVEQLVAESTGKHGMGIVPVIDEPALDIDRYGDDRLFVSLTVAGAADAADDYVAGAAGAAAADVAGAAGAADAADAAHRRLIAALEAAGHPVLRFVVGDPIDLGGEFFRWEAAVALLGALMELDPFDQPDVQAAKDRATGLLAAHRQGTPMADRPPLAQDTDWAVFADLGGDRELAERQRGADLPGWLHAHLGRAEVPDYIGIQAFLVGGEEVESALHELRALFGTRLGVVTTLGWGPAFLHSTGQLHKGGPDTGVFLQLTADAAEDIEVPEAGHTLGELLRAQSLGDLAALQERGRRVLRVHLRDEASGCRALLAAAATAFPPNAG